ncbi:hypothetical protein EV401DRAFT_1579825 [Pisolithus croceorrhizus]|nr:hypothetical protein EV401DRAFT_1579825 [Pisolithus croceorrhizus]
MDCDVSTARPYLQDAQLLKPPFFLVKPKIVESIPPVVHLTESPHFSMARQHPKKHGLLRFGKSRSTPNPVSAGPLHVPTADAISTITTRENGFRGTLARTRRFFNQANYIGPCSVTPEEVGTSVGGAMRGQQELQQGAVPSQDVCDLLRLTENALTRLGGQNLTANNETELELALGVDDAARAFDNMDPMSRLTGNAINIMDANTTFTHIQNFTDTYLKPFKTFNELVTTLSKVHPYAQIALGILAAASHLLMKQANLDKAVSGLLQTIRTVYEFLTEEDTINNIDSMKDTLAKIAWVISDSVQFIKDYSETKNF